MVARTFAETDITHHDAPAEMDGGHQELYSKKKCQECRKGKPPEHQGKHRGPKAPDAQRYPKSKGVQEEPTQDIRPPAKGGGETAQRKSPSHPNTRATGSCGDESAGSAGSQPPRGGSSHGPQGPEAPGRPTPWREPCPGPDGPGPTEQPPGIGQHPPRHSPPNIDHHHATPVPKPVNPQQKVPHEEDCPGDTSHMPCTGLPTPTNPLLTPPLKTLFIPPSTPFGESRNDSPSTGRHPSPGNSPPPSPRTRGLNLPPGPRLRTAAGEQG
ncbi:PREDICTED: proline-rich protein HaeIII subfamily 1-like [Cyprinodon variegatus]|uniref:proline-rich protein HaeIII subfamily 1-like n=1 Tax=Cyprinodon variegatus TaxID=28743 RepID=UPI000742829B|nr:PREDICTED: proline-rich protein HaeIII subfamily 1-like [Cyprinodon variegatus]